MKRALHRLSLLLVAGSLLAGCGAIRSTVGIVEAEKALRAAEEAGARETAPYATTLADQLLDKAREEQGYAEYSTSFELAREAEAKANEALELARKAPPVTRMAPMPTPAAASEGAPAAEEAMPAEGAAAEPAAEEATPAAEEATPAAEEATPAEEPSP